MAGENDTLDQQVAADVGATSQPSPAPESADTGDATAGVERAEPDAKHVETKSDVEDIVDRFLERHPPKEDNEFDPIAPKPAPSDGADLADQSRDSTAAPPPADTAPPEPEKLDDEALPDGKPADWLTKEEMAALGPKAKARIESLWRENRDYVRFADEADPFLKPIREANLPLDDVKTACAVAGLVNAQDWGTFLEVVTPYVTIAKQALGLELPPELRRRVDDGEMTEEAAAEISRAHYVAAKEATQRQQAEARLTHTEQERQQADQHAHVHAITQAVNGWEEQQRTRDPDYKRLRPLILDKMVAFAAQNGPPPSPEAGLRLAEWAKQEVMKALPATNGKARATAPAPSGNGSAKAPPRAEPKSVYDHVFSRLGIS